MDGTFAKASLGIVPLKPRPETAEKYPRPESSTPHSDWKVVNQMRALKQQIGLGTILGTVAILIAIGAPAVKQGEINGSTAKALEKLTDEQKTGQQAAEKALSDAVTRIETGINQAVLLAQQGVAIGHENTAEMRNMRESFDRRIDQVANKADSAWNNMVELRRDLGKIEAEKKQE